MFSRTPFTMSVAVSPGFRGVGCTMFLPPHAEAGETEKVELVTASVSSFVISSVAVMYCAVGLLTCHVLSGSTFLLMLYCTVGTVATAADAVGVGSGFGPLAAKAGELAAESASATVRTAVVSNVFLMGISSPGLWPLDQKGRG